MVGRCRSLGCDFAQGYLIARPLDEAQLLQWIGERARAGSKKAVTQAAHVATGRKDQEGRNS